MPSGRALGNQVCDLGVSDLGLIEPGYQNVVAFLVFSLIESYVSVLLDAPLDELGSDVDLCFQLVQLSLKGKSILGTIDRAIDSSIQLRSKKDLIHGFINTVNAATDVDRDWQSYVQPQKQQELEQIIAEEKLKPTEAQRFVANAFRDGALKTTGTDIDQILPPVSRFGGGNRTEKKKTIIQRLAQFFEKYFGI